MEDKLNKRLILNRMLDSYEETKKKTLENLHDYDFYGLAMRYEMCEWGEEALEHNSLSQKELDLLSQQKDPLEFLYDIWLNYDDDLWEVFNIMLNNEANRGEQ